MEDGDAIDVFQQQTGGDANQSPALPSALPLAGPILV